MSGSPYAGKCALVTGGAGFIGSHLVEALLAVGARVRVLDSLEQGRLDNLKSVIADVDLHKADIRDDAGVRRAVDGIQVVFHLAANASVPRSVSDPRHDFVCNAEGTLNLLCALRGSGVECCVVASSGAVYGEPTKHPIEEGDPLLPISPYGAGKMSAEALCHSFSASYGLPVTIARIFNTYGPRQPRFVMYDFYRKLRADPTRLAIMGNGKQIRDFCYVADTVSALMHLASRTGTGCDAFNVSSGASHSVLDVATVMFDILGLHDVEVTFTGQSWAGDAQRWEVSIDKVRRHTEYRPSHDLMSGLGLFVQWFNDNPERAR